MSAWKQWQDIKAADTAEILGLLDEQTRTRATEQSWDLFSATAQIGTILDRNIEVHSLAYSAYQFDTNNPTSFQLSERWALVWERLQTRALRRAPRMHRQKPQLALQMPGWRRPSVRAYRAAVQSTSVMGITGAGYLAVTQPPVIFWPGTLLVLAIYGWLRRPGRIEISEHDWIAITKAVAHKRFNRVKSATLDVGINHENSTEHIADAIASAAHANSDKVLPTPKPLSNNLKPEPLRPRRRHGNARSMTEQAANRAKYYQKLDEAREQTDISVKSAPDTGQAGLSRRVAGVHAALAQLDQEWMDYERDWHAWTLAQPLLHVPEVPQTAAYNDALYELREITYTLADTASETEIVAGEKAADTALRAWDIAQDHAAAIGIADRSPLEQRTLRRLHHLVGQLADPSTPKPMWQQLITQIDRQLKNLETVQISWSQIQLLPALEASPRIQAIQQFAEVPNA